MDLPLIWKTSRSWGEGRGHCGAAEASARAWSELLGFNVWSTVSATVRTTVQSLKAQDDGSYSKLSAFRPRAEREYAAGADKLLQLSLKSILRSGRDALLHAMVSSTRRSGSHK